jgi:hypothetical protein
MALKEEMKTIERFVHDNCVDKKDIEHIKNKIVPQMHEWKENIDRFRIEHKDMKNCIA